MTRIATGFLWGWVCLGGIAPLAWADGPGPQTYPRVIGPSGRPYGPTQAHYQYEKRYGRSWDGTVTGNQGYPVGTRNYHAGSGFTYGPGHHHHHHYLNDYGHGWGWGLGGVGLGITVGSYGGYPVSIYSGPGFGWNPSPVVTPGYFDPYSIPGGYIYNSPSTYVVPPVPWGGSVVAPFPQQPWEPGLQPRIDDPLLDRGVNLPKVYGIPQDGLDGSLPPIVPQSSPEAKLRSIQDQGRGDEHLVRLDYPSASQWFRKAILAARDRVDPVYRYGLVLVAQARYVEAVQQFKLASGLDSTWTQHAPNLDTLFGHKNTMEKVQIKHRVAEWTQQNVRDPDRIYLLSLMLHLDGDPRGQSLIDTAMKIGGPQPHLAALKIPRQPDPGAVPPGPGVPAAPGVPPANGFDPLAPNAFDAPVAPPVLQPSPLPAP